MLDAAGFLELGFGVDEEEGYTWAMIVRTEDIASLDRMVWTSWDIANLEPGEAPGEPDNYSSVRASIAAGVAIDWESGPGPRTSLN